VRIELRESIALHAREDVVGVGCEVLELERAIRAELNRHRIPRGVARRGDAHAGFEGLAVEALHATRKRESGHDLDVAEIHLGALAIDMDPRAERGAEPAYRRGLGIDDPVVARADRHGAAVAQVHLARRVDRDVDELELAVTIGSDALLAEESLSAAI